MNIAFSVKGKFSSVVCRDSDLTGQKLSEKQVTV